MTTAPKCFISYSWDSENHKEWVRLLADQLIKNGIETKLDQYDISFGDQIPRYMESSVRESDFVLLICTPSFASKADAGKGGVGYETGIVTGQIFTDVASDRKFIPVLKDGEPKISLPSYLKTRAWVDFRDDHNFELNLENLLRHIYGEPKFTRPALGKKPSFSGGLNILQSVSPISQKNYRALATSKTPALIIFLLDVSGSMSSPFEGGITRVDAVSKSLQKIAVRMVQRSTRGTKVAPRYRIGMFAYSSQVIDLLGGVKTIEELAKLGVPVLTTLDKTDTAGAFTFAEELLKQEIPNIQDCPAPLICHLTDGEYSDGVDPFPIMQRISSLSVPDGNVLIENIYMKEDISVEPIHSAKDWKGFQSVNQLKDEYAKSLLRSSSVIPESYRVIFDEFGYKLHPQSRLFFPGSTTDLIDLAFAMSSMD